MNHLKDHVRTDYFRMNLFFDGEEPSLDDVGQMPDLPRQVHAQLHQNDCPTVARALQTAQFFFELIFTTYRPSIQTLGSCLTTAQCSDISAPNIAVQIVDFSD